MEAYILAIDIGTSSLKSAIINTKGQKLAFAHIPLRQKTKAVFASEWKNALLMAMAGLTREMKLSILSPRAISISGHGPSLVLLNNKKEELAPVLMWHETGMNKIEGTKSYFLPKLAHFREKHPDIFAEIAHVFSCPEYLIHELSGESWTILPNEAYESAFFTMNEIARYNMPHEIFSAFNYSGSFCGSVHDQASKRYGIEKNIPVFAGGPDFIMSLVGTNCLTEGLCTDRAGSSEGINYCTEKKIFVPSLRTLPHLNPKLNNIARILPASGMLFEWFRGITGQKGKSYQEMLLDISKIENTTELPYFIPDPKQTGSFKDAQFINLLPEHEAAHISRAVVESLAFMVREGIEIIENHGLEISELRMCGGQAKNELWCRLKTEIIDKPIWIPEIEDAELLGNCAIASYGLGDYKSIEEAASHLVRKKCFYEPKALDRNKSADRYEAWKVIRDRTMII